MSAYNTESALARLLHPHYAHGDDEARALLREPFTLSGDIQITCNTLHVQLDPGTDLTVAYNIKGQPDTA